ncbi:MAG TPA: ATP synthase F1 subunit delta [Flavobacteriales bacterium]|nr:ATP synthase F1 subunit delta [Flavobacteriales bacterium]|tara:strand:- start:18242 stop:18799 length:558 start_codon:yes stop_codon:yes gene_type:complete
MKEVRVASRYAKSLLGLAVEQNKLDKIYQDMLFVKNTIADSRELELLLKNPIIKKDKKEKILNEIFASHIDTVPMMFINIITRKNRERILFDIADAFIHQYKVYNNIVTAEVTTAIPLDDKLKNEIIEQIKKSENGNVEVDAKVDKSIIGGIIVRVGDKQLNESIKYKLNQLRKQFDDNLYIKEY